VCQLLVTANVVHSSPILVILMIEALGSSETSVFQEPFGVTSQKTAFFMNFSSMYCIKGTAVIGCFVQTIGVAQSICVGALVDTRCCVLWRTKYFFLFTVQTGIHGYLMLLIVGIKRPGREADFPVL
jgi:hypothetical protein